MSVFILQSVEPLEEPQPDEFICIPRWRTWRMWRKKEALECGTAESCTLHFQRRAPRKTQGYTWLLEKRSEITIPSVFLWRTAEARFWFDSVKIYVPLPLTGLRFNSNRRHLLFVAPPTRIFFFYTAPLAHISQPICQTHLPRGIAFVKTGVVGFLVRVDFLAGERDCSLPDKRSHSGAVCYGAARLHAALIKANLPATRTTEGKSEDELLLLPSVHAPNNL